MRDPYEDYYEMQSYHEYMERLEFCYRVEVYSTREDKWVLHRDYWDLDVAVERCITLAAQKLERSRVRHLNTIRSDELVYECECDQYGQILDESGWYIEERAFASAFDAECSMPSVPWSKEGF